MGRLGLGELLLIFAVLLLLFGATRLPLLGSSLGSAIRNFKKGFSGEDEPDSSGTRGQLRSGEGGEKVASTAEKRSETHHS
jgi:sec-independent protein translocase protein TatA